MASKKNEYVSVMRITKIAHEVGPWLNLALNLGLTRDVPDLGQGLTASLTQVK